MPTDNHSYNKPRKGASDWHKPLNENFESIDADVEIRAPEEEILDNGTPKSGAKALATDTRAIFFGDGSQWVRFGVLPTADELGSPFFTTGRDATAERVLVAETGDDIQPAIDAFAEAGTKGIVQLLPKTYEPPEMIEMKAGRGAVLLRGAGHPNLRAVDVYTTISGTNVADGNPIIRYRTNEEDLTAHGAQIHNVRVDGARDSGKSVHGIDIGFVGNARLYNCNITMCKRHGIVVRGTQSAELERVVAGRCGDQANDWHVLDLGGVVESSDDFNRATVVGSIFVGNGPVSHATPLKLRNGSTLRLKSDAVRTGARGQDLSVPIVDVDGGNLEAENITITTNLNVKAPAIKLHNNGSVLLVNSVVEKADPNILFTSGDLNLVDCDIMKAKTHANGGHGIDASGGRQRATIGSLISCRIFRNQGHGLRLFAPAERPWVDLEIANSGKYGIYEDFDWPGATRIYGVRFAGNSQGPIKQNHPGMVKLDPITPPSSTAFVNRNNGIETFSGDGSTQSFEFEHRMSETPAHLDLSRRSAGARAGGAWSWSATKTEITVTFATPPVSGSENVVFDWRAFGPTSLHLH